MTFDFKATLLPNGQIALPAEIAGQIPVGTELQIAVKWEEAAADSYRALGAKLHEAAYAPEETVYDSLA
jgi:hypothetical protein